MCWSNLDFKVKEMEAAPARSSPGQSSSPPVGQWRTGKWWVSHIPCWQRSTVCLLGPDNQMITPPESESW